MKNVKWIMGIEVTDTDYPGYRQQRGWSDEAVRGFPDGATGLHAVTVEVVSAI